MTLDEIVSVPLKNLPRYYSGYGSGKISETDDNGKIKITHVTVEIIGYLSKMQNREVTPNSPEEVKILELLVNKGWVNYSKKKQSYSLSSNAYKARYSLIPRK